nr:hypothetical protein [Ningiella sp. W23]
MQFPAAYILSNHTELGDEGIWYSFAITNITIALIAFAWFMRGSWKKPS